MKPSSIYIIINFNKLSDYSELKRVLFGNKAEEIAHNRYRGF